MDIISHGLWSGALFKSINLKSKKKRFNFWHAAFWGMFPDLFTFVIPYTLWIFTLLSEKASLSDFINIQEMGATTSTFPYYSFVSISYNISHSIIIFLIIFIIAWLIFRKPIWIMCGWLLHILMDIFTHINGHSPTPILWPLLNLKINGLIYWRNQWFMFADVVLLIITYWIIFRMEKKRKRRKK